ncbi:hypothetical protein Rsub_02288 [Raphidocelis subcapitata]|uniref:Pherophorin domain-containing protein n=1 Tax=Raphidocelis subcapitata TaxID=307507 RepID=A0A2V0NVH4_9CHLO|nr:hypothetical protein Rsub_02288 [Raphidocelis subcapitata]|eukprot:GBF89570.1 hypothetical protein Rsub_02288 [Raphidocelis subcapitata]
MLRPRQLVLITLLLGTAAAARPLPLQVDVCGKAAPKSTAGGAPAPAMFLQVSKGVCTVATRLLPPAGANVSAFAASPMELSFPCTSAVAGAPLANLDGPALNVWAELRPAPAAAGGNTPNATAAAVAAAQAGAVEAPDLCDLTTLSPVMYFKTRVPPTYFYGYDLKGVPCRRTPSAARAAEAEGAETVYGLALVPEITSPAHASGGADEKAFTTGAQTCRLVVTAMGRNYMHVSNDSFPCNMVTEPEKSRGAGRCFSSP